MSPSAYTEGARVREDQLIFRWFSTGLVAASLMIGCAPAPDEGGPEVTKQPLAAELAEWNADGAVETYDTESIFAYIDGHAEVFLAYGMQRCISRRYVGPEGSGEIIVDLFEMPSAADAYGVFSHDRAGEEVAVGQGGIFRHGWLSFWKGPWYGSIYSTEGDEGARQAVLDVGAAVADTLEGGGDVPELVNRMPSSGLDPASVCFLRSPQILNAHVFVGGDNLFGLGPGVETVVGKYDLGGAVAHLVLVQYPDEAAAETVERRVREDVGAEGQRPSMVIGRNGALLAAVIGDESNEDIEGLLEETLRGGA
jgi:Family of unknown function (DUF6599)